MTDLQTLRYQTLTIRSRIGERMQSLADRGDAIPPGWNNNLRWHAGHLVVTPRLLTFGLMKEPLGVPEAYRTLFAKGTGPRSWGAAAVPSIGQLADALTAGMEAVLDAFEARGDEPFPEPYLTSAGVALRTPGEALLFSQTHDGIHLGLVMALSRALG